ncbi:hypothetical protein [Pseudomonas brassicacearum]|uniref:hypothetical protein n=1 Tax=Pseudomonas brassicacearum TaxID=930166 RepID=UPI0011AF5BBE|nr:hypothetical protein [Pseudomonas brassicacearum]
MLSAQNIAQDSDLMAKSSRDCVRVWDTFDSYVAHWRTLGEQLYPASFAMEPSSPRASSIRGKIANKHFSINAGSVLVTDRLFIEVLVVAEFLELGVRKESLRFLISPFGDFHQSDGAKVIGAFDEKSNYTVLVKFLVQVLKTSMPCL